MQPKSKFEKAPTSFRIRIIDRDGVAEVAIIRNTEQAAIAAAKMIAEKYGYRAVALVYPYVGDAAGPLRRMYIVDGDGVARERELPIRVIR